jgi:hypothetical protein
MGPYAASACVQSRKSALTLLNFASNADSENLVTEQSLAVLKAKIKVTILCIRHSQLLSQCFHPSPFSPLQMQHSEGAIVLEPIDLEEGLLLQDAANDLGFTFLLYSLNFIIYLHFALT